jgi:hypothetical protein
MEIHSILFVKDLDDHRRSKIITGELPGPYANEDGAVEHLEPGQVYTIRDGILYAEAIRETATGDEPEEE